MKNNSLIWLIVMAVGVVLLGLRWTLAEHGFGKAYVGVSHEMRYRIPGEKIPDEKLFDTDHPTDKWFTVEGAAKIGLDAKNDSIESRDRVITDEATFREYTDQQDKAKKAAAQNPSGAPPPAPDQTQIFFSPSRTIGVWVGAIFTLFVLTFLFGDNPLYKVAESIFIGISAAYWMVVGFWTTLAVNLFAKVWPEAIRNWSMPGLSSYERTEWLYLIPLVLSIMLLWRLAPKGGWISRWPMAFIIGVFCGLRLITFIHADFISQIRNGIVPLWVNTAHTDASGATVMSFDPWQSLRSVFLVVGVMTCLVYFFFSIEHTGIVGKTARVGIWFLMITFGAAFGYTVMGRIALLAARFEFLFDDWLWLIDPGTKHTVEAAQALILPIQTLAHHAAALLMSIL